MYDAAHIVFSNDYFLRNIQVAAFRFVWSSRLSPVSV